MAFEPTATVMRPTTFDDLAGQEFVASTLKHAFAQGRIAPAYLFSGPRGVGKTSAARILAKALNCEAGLTGTPCGTCSSCKDITKSTAMDVLEIDGASNTSVNDVREIKDEVLFAPAEGRYKVYIIDEVHMLSNSAFNALLKTIEEPPPYVVFVFATTEIHKVPATIRSRCQQFHFRLIPQETIEAHLGDVATRSNFTAEPEALRWIAREAAGSMRDAYTLFDQVAAFSQGTITMEETRQKLKLMGTEKIAQILGYLVEQKVPEALSLMENELNKGVEVERFVTELSQYLRALLLLKHGVSSEVILTQRVDEFPENLRNAFTPAQIEVALELCLGLFRNIRYSLSQRYELELVLIRIAMLPKMASSEELVQRLEELKEAAQSGSLPVAPQEKPKKIATQSTPVVDTDSSPATPPKTPKEVPQQESPSDPKPQEPVATQQEKSGKLSREQWKQFTSLLGEDMALRSLLSKVLGQKYDSNGFYVLVSGGYEQKQLEQKSAIIEPAISSVLGSPHKFIVKVHKKEAPKQETKTEADNDPLALVQDVFRGTIINPQEKN